MIVSFAIIAASIFHWRNRADCTDKNLSIGYWQASRIRAILGQVEKAKRCAEICLSYSKSLEPFYLGYAYEALARAAYVAGEHERAKTFVDQAIAQAAVVEDSQNRELLLIDSQDRCNKATQKVLIFVSFTKNFCQKTNFEQHKNEAVKIGSIQC